MKCAHLNGVQIVNTSGEAVTLKGKARHDPCVVPRAVPIVEAMAALVLADHLLRAQFSRMYAAQVEMKKRVRGSQNHGYSRALYCQAKRARNNT